MVLIQYESARSHRLESISHHIAANPVQTVATTKRTLILGGFALKVGIDDAFVLEAIAMKRYIKREEN
mgnify:CR=1 FL=1